jgi:hypothetical protein
MTTRLVELSDHLDANRVARGELRDARRTRRPVNDLEHSVRPS